MGWNGAFDDGGLPVGTLPLHLKVNDNIHTNRLVLGLTANRGSKPCATRLVQPV